jgi:hypothetical protein
VVEKSVWVSFPDALISYSEWNCITKIALQLQFKNKATFVGAKK